jgi:EpsI family protein
VSTTRRRYLVVIVAMAILAPLALYLQYDVPPPEDIESLKEAIPKRIGMWTMIRESGPSEDEIRILETKAILTRTYSCGFLPEMELSVVFAKDNRRVAHPPEICYKGAGWNVEGKQIVEFPVGDEPFRANRRLLTHGEQRLLLLYWYNAGREYTPNYLLMQGLIIKAHLLNRRSSSALIRVSTRSPSAADDEEIAAQLCKFAAQAIPHVTAAIR